MKSFRFALYAVLLLLAPLAFTQAAAPKPEAPKSEAQKSFDALKTIAGEWEGPVTVNPLLPGMKEQPIKPLRLTMRVTSRGNAIVHEFQEANTPLDPLKYDHPVTMLYLDSGQLNLIHYCDAGNRPHMTGKLSPDGKQVEFEFVDISGNTQYGHMHHAIFTFIDENHHTEDWTFMLPGEKPVHAHFDLHRVDGKPAVSLLK